MQEEKEAKKKEKAREKKLRKYADQNDEKLELVAKALKLEQANRVLKSNLDSGKVTNKQTHRTAISWTPSLCHQSKKCNLSAILK